MTIEQMKARKIELGLTSEMISQQSGVPLGTVQKLFGGITKAPRKQTIDAIERVLRPGTESEQGGNPTPNAYPAQGFDSTTNAYPMQGGGSSQSLYPEMGGPTVAAVRETSAQYSAMQEQRLYTIDDYYALPEDQRVELIDGVFYDMAAPSTIHQIILGELYYLFRICIESHKEAPCMVFFAPYDVRLDKDNYTMLQPDLMISCHPKDITMIRYEGAPDLVVEILSPSTRMKDMVLKLHKYQNAGVREYWIIDSKHKTVTVHLFESEDYDPRKYSFEEKIPIGISEGKCSVDFSKVYDRLTAYYEAE